jgi:hypothetical protein
MRLFRKKTVKESYDPERQKPVIHCSICNGEQVAGLIDQEARSACLVRNMRITLRSRNYGRSDLDGRERTHKSRAS